ncbi:beta-D-glucosyl crocetin beta-1,6-glucosyltransferase-like protein, partial [Tanacetum coccineum]
ELTDLQSELHFTNGPPVHLMAILKHAFDLSSPRFLEVLEDLSLNLLIYDILQPWAPATAAGLGIPSMVFITTSVVAFMYHFELNAPKDDWLDTKAVGSTVFLSFGSEYFLSSADLVEIAYGLEKSDVNFIWVLRFLKGEGEIDLSEALPSGFFKRVENRGLVVKGWGSQYKILGHKNIGRFVSHYGWSSILEAMKFGVPIIAMPTHLDQPINDWLVVEVGVVLKVVRVKGRLTSHNVFEVVQQAVVGEEGQAVKKKAKKLRDSLKKRKMRRV